MSLSPGMTFAASASVVSSAMAAGAMAGLSLCAVPAIFQVSVPSSVMLKQWSIVYNNGKAIPLTALLAAISYGVVSYNQHAKDSPRWRGFALAGVLTVAAIPFTMVVLMPTIKVLEEAGQSQTKTLSDDRVRSLVRKWMHLNTIRCSLPLTGAVVGLWALLS
ncbi:hypothetical protein SCAR479_07834 [Seiridium cardinale]|uniref:DUF1772-domain-containing protein n=1 Tax=Seiridium cardinale TaxID=138064 RepID=A0ABR2XP40_9PEZI